MANKEVTRSNNGGSSQLATSSPPLMSLRAEIDRMFDRFMNHDSLPGLFDWDNFAKLPTRSLSAGLTLRSDFSESDDGYELTVEMPGLTDKDVDVSVSDDTVTVKGEKKQQSEKKEDDYHMMERSYGSFRRSFTLPHGVNADSISAKVKDGILTVTLPKTAEAKKKARKIEIKAS